MGAAIAVVFLLWLVIYHPLYALVYGVIAAVCIAVWIARNQEKPARHPAALAPLPLSERLELLDDAQARTSAAMRAAAARYEADRAYADCHLDLTTPSTELVRYERRDRRG